MHTKMMNELTLTADRLAEAFDRFDLEVEVIERYSAPGMGHEECFALLVGDLGPRAAAVLGHSLPIDEALDLVSAMRTESKGREDTIAWFPGWKLAAVYDNPEPAKQAKRPDGEVPEWVSETRRNGDWSEGLEAVSGDLEQYRKNRAWLEEHGQPVEDFVGDYSRWRGNESPETAHYLVVAVEGSKDPMKKARKILATQWSDAPKKYRKDVLRRVAADLGIDPKGKK